MVRQEGGGGRGAMQEYKYIVKRAANHDVVIHKEGSVKRDQPGYIDKQDGRIYTRRGWRLQSHFFFERYNAILS